MPSFRLVVLFFLGYAWHVTALYRDRALYRRRVSLRVHRKLRDKSQTEEGNVRVYEYT